MLGITRSNLPAYGLFAIFLACNIVIWAQTHKMRPAWGNVPPVMSERGATMMAAGDKQLAHRGIAMMLQNLGGTGGDSVSLKKYDYKALGQWFHLEDELDPHSNFVPYLAAYFFGATPKVEDLTPVIDYLAETGQRPGAQRWRWIAEAIILARFRQGDLQKALELANIMAGIKDENMPLWAKAMPAFIINAQGDRQAAYGVMMGILKSGINTLSPVEIRFLRDNICNKILTPEQAGRDEFCIKTK